MSEEINAADAFAMAEDEQIPNSFVEFADLMISPEHIPKKAKDDFWGYLSKDTILAHIMTDDRWGLQNSFVIQRNFDIMSKPAFKINIEAIKDYENTRNRFTMQVSRGIKGFERDRLAMQIREIRTSSAGGGKESGGIWAGFKKKLGFGPKVEGGEQNAPGFS